jgi:hypothetical protein
VDIERPYHDIYPISEVEEIQIFHPPPSNHRMSIGHGAVVRPLALLLAVALLLRRMLSAPSEETEILSVSAQPAAAGARDQNHAPFRRRSSSRQHSYRQVLHQLKSIVPPADLTGVHSGGQSGARVPDSGRSTRQSSDPATMHKTDGSYDGYDEGEDDEGDTYSYSDEAAGVGLSSDRTAASGVAARLDSSGR